MSAHDRAYELIKSEILGNGSSLIEPIVEAQLSHRLGVSRTPIREALRLLESEGLVTHQQGKGWRVAFLSSRDLAEIFEVKLLLEPAAAARAAELASDEERTRLLEIVDRMTQSAEARDAQAWLLADKEFHQVLLLSARNSYLMQTVNNLNERWWRVQVGISAMSERVQSGSEEHRGIAQAVASRDGETARSITQEHLTAVWHSVEAAIRATRNLSSFGF